MSNLTLNQSQVIEPSGNERLIHVPELNQSQVIEPSGNKFLIHVPESIRLNRSIINKALGITASLSDSIDTS